MAKKKNNQNKTEIASPIITSSKEVFSFFNFKTNVFLLFLFCAVFYGNTLVNEFALDDVIVITGNKFTQQGFKGIHNIFTKETFQGYFTGASSLTGGRWRPLSLITFAIEHQFFGDNTFVYHFNNVLLYFLTSVLILLFLSKHVFTEKPFLAFLVAVLFLIHPIHTEVVANIKSRDELLSLLFLLLTLHLSLDYIQQERKKITTLILSLVCYLLALFSKENGITFLAIIPLTFWFFTQLELKKIMIQSIPFWIVGGIYLAIRFSIIGFAHTAPIPDINTMPYAYATTLQMIATIIFILGKYLLMLFFPHPLSSDYSYNQIPYVSFSNPLVWLTIVMYVAMFVWAVMKLKTKNIFSYGIFFYFITLFIVSNIVVDTGAIMGERFLYLPSLGLLIAVVYLLDKIYSRVVFINKKIKMQISYIIFSAIVLLCAIKTIARNAEWKNDTTLFLKDVETCPNSVRTNIAAGSAMLKISNAEKDSVIKNQEIQKGIAYSQKAIEISPGSLDPLLNLGVAYFNLGDYDLAEKYWTDVRTKNSNYDFTQYDLALSVAYLNKGMAVSKEKKYEQTIFYFYKAIKINPNNAEYWYNLGGVYFTIAKYDSASFAWNKTLQLNPNHEQAKQGLNALVQVKK